MAKKEKMSEARKQLIQSLINDDNIKSANDVHDALKDLFKDALQEMLNAELTEHLGYEKNEYTDNNDNYRNGYSSKTVHSSEGDIKLAIPRDRQGTFDPIVVEKGQKDISNIEEKIIKMYARGMSNQMIYEEMEELYGVKITPDMVTAITDKIIPEIREWQKRQLEEQYAIVFVDATYFNVKQDGIVVKKAVYIALVVTIIVLLILAGVTIQMVLGKNGIIGKAKKAKEVYAETEQNDIAKLEEMQSKIEELTGKPNKNKGLWVNDTKISDYSLETLLNSLKYELKNHCNYDFNEMPEDYVSPDNYGIKVETINDNSANIITIFENELAVYGFVRIETDPETGDSSISFRGEEFNKLYTVEVENEKTMQSTYLKGQAITNENVLSNGNQVNLISKISEIVTSLDSELIKKIMGEPGNGNFAIGLQPNEQVNIALQLEQLESLQETWNLDSNLGIYFPADRNKNTIKVGDGIKIGKEKFKVIKKKTINLQ